MLWEGVMLERLIKLVFFGLMLSPVVLVAETASDPSCSKRGKTLTREVGFYRLWEEEIGVGEVEFALFSHGNRCLVIGKSALVTLSRWLPPESNHKQYFLEPSSLVFSRHQARCKKLKKKRCTLSTFEIISETSAYLSVYPIGSSDVTRYFYGIFDSKVFLEIE